MLDRLLGDYPNMRGTPRSAARPVGFRNGRHSTFVSDDVFAAALCLERKRAERSGKLMVLMLLEAEDLLRSEPDAFQKIVEALFSTTRETDVAGWYKRGSVIGVLFTEIGDAVKVVIAKTILAKMDAALSRHLGRELAKEITVLLNFFPEDWDTKDPGAKVNSTLYPDQFAKLQENRIPHVLKRSIDALGCFFGLLILSPLFGLIALLIKLTSPGPVFFRQKRVGQYGKTFEVLKFRSMHAANDPAIHKAFVQELITGKGKSLAKGQNGEGTFKIKKDPRVTPVGRLLRKSSMDELPQLWNVLKGEMSLVGPRPPIPYELECYDIWHRRRLLEAKPGITGLWQVNGRSRTTFDEMVRLDLKYAQTWSLMLDLKILLKTPMAVFSGEGAY
ncbi:MAG: sugar transferase [Terriglobia bacterium]